MCKVQMQTIQNINGTQTNIHYCIFNGQPPKEVMSAPYRATTIHHASQPYPFWLCTSIHFTTATLFSRQLLSMVIVDSSFFTYKIYNRKLLPIISICVLCTVIICLQCYSIEMVECIKKKVRQLFINKRT